MAYQPVGVEDVMRLRRAGRRRMRCDDISHKPWNPLEAVTAVTTLCFKKRLAHEKTNNSPEVGNDMVLFVQLVWLI